MQLVVNQLLQNQHDLNKLERIVWIDAENRWCFLVNVNEPSFPYRLRVGDIIQRLETEELKNVQIDPWNISVKESELTEIEKQKRDFAWEVIQYIYHLPDILVPKSRSKLIKKASIEFGVSQKTIRGYLKRFWSRGMGKSGLLPDYFNCGKHQAGERKYTKKAGRPTLYASSIKRATVEEDWKRIFRIVLEKYYFIQSKPSLKYAYQQMLKDYFSRTDNDSDYKVLDLERPIPTYDQFYYFYRKQYKADYAIYKRDGRREYLQNYRAITGSATEDSMGIGVYAVDGTIGDIYLTSSISKKSVIGRPTIFLIVDIFSRCIVGINVSIENMSGESLRIALANTFENKKEWCKRTLDLELSEDDWPIHYIPHTLLADRGSELISDELTNLVENLNIKIQNTAPYRPELKGICEAYFGIIQQHLIPFLPGTVQKDFNKRGSQDYRKNAVLNLNQYTRILVKCIIHYNNRFLKDYPLTQYMIDENVLPVPIEIFKWGLRNGTGQLKTMTSDTIRSNVYPIQKATITAKGILLNGLYYSCTTAVKERWFSIARQQGTWKIDVHYDPQNVSHIYIRHDRKSYEICSLIDQYEMYRSARMEEVINLKRNKRQQEADFQEKQLNGQIKLAQEIEEIVKHAKEEDKIESINGSIRKNIKDIRSNRRAEQELMREISSSTNQSNDIEIGSNSINLSTNQVKNLDLFRQKQKEGLNNEDY
ncbi:Mu transposase C-terminal domain-containing protein [Metabacillus idriensis]|uniref:Mu transposase C-terminal domain-containing protein n=1 Tax=Metabacillus idriensis TaxID=324768 RepID=UPI00174AC4F7|nr:Mu transposase C-terminal domain-containing protein [Metabacillus idriensis]